MLHLVLRKLRPACRPKLLCSPNLPAILNLAAKFVPTAVAISIQQRAPPSEDRSAPCFGQISGRNPVRSHSENKNSGNEKPLQKERENGVEEKYPNRNPSSRGRAISLLFPGNTR